MFFFFLNYFIGPKYVEIFKSLRVDLPLPTCLTIQIINNAAVVSFFLVGVALLLHYLRRRKFLVIFILFMSATCLVEILSIYLPIVKITEALRKQ